MSRLVVTLDSLLTATVSWLNQANTVVPCFSQNILQCPPVLEAEDSTQLFSLFWFTVAILEIVQKGDSARERLHSAVVIKHKCVFLCILTMLAGDAFHDRSCGPYELWQRAIIGSRVTVSWGLKQVSLKQTSGQRVNLYRVHDCSQTLTTTVFLHVSFVICTAL